MNEKNPMKLDVYINYNGNCKEAFQFYEKHLGGKIIMMQTFNQSPEHSNVPPGWENSIELSLEIQLLWEQIYLMLSRCAVLT